MVEFLKGGSAPKRDYFYWELHENNGGSIQAIRWDDWKAVRPKKGGQVELYNLADDLGESKNLAAKHPDLVAKAVEMMRSARTPDPDWPDPAVR